MVKMTVLFPILHDSQVYCLIFDSNFIVRTDRARMFYSELNRKENVVFQNALVEKSESST